MAREYEFEGKTKEEAVAKASQELGIAEDELDVEVVSFGSTGIFGLVGVKKAKIKVTVPDAQSPEALSPDAPSLVAPSPEPEPVSVPEAHVTPEEVAAGAKVVLEKIASFIVEDVTITADTNANGVRLTVHGGNTALLIGKHGRTLDALQYLVQKAVQNKQRTNSRVTVDVEGYRERRKDSLTQLALRLGEKVKRSGKPATINPMNAYDRRIVHVALKDDTKIRTQSMGSGALRKLVIYPQKKRPKEAQDSGPKDA
jgi:spoIIIJ-associated protein